MYTDDNLSHYVIINIEQPIHIAYLNVYNIIYYSFYNYKNN